LLDMGDVGALNFHAPHWHGNTVLSHGTRRDTIFLLPLGTETADMIPERPWPLAIPLRPGRPHGGGHDCAGRGLTPARSDCRYEATHSLKRADWALSQTRGDSEESGGLPAFPLRRAPFPRAV